MKRNFLSLRRLSVDFENGPACPVSIQRPRSEQSRAREQAGQSPDHNGVGLNMEQSYERQNRSLTVAARLRERRSSHRANGTSRFIVQNGKLELRLPDAPRRSPRFSAVSQVALPPLQRFNALAAPKRGEGGFTLVEILVTLVLLSMIVLALMAVFSGIQRAFRASLTQTDTLEGGRAVMDLIANDMTTMTPCNLNSNEISAPLGTFSAVNFAATEQTFALANPPTPLLQPLLSSPSGASRTDLLENIFILSKANINGVPSWVGTGYSVSSNLADGTLYPLYRFYMVTNASSGSAGVGQLYSGFSSFNYADTTNWSHLMDGVVNLTARVFDTNGIWMTNGYINPLISHVRFVQFAPRPYGVTDCAFFSNAVPASVQIEMGTMEDHTLRHAESLAGVNQSYYLSNAAGQVHIFRQRVWIRNMDPTAYE